MVDENIKQFCRLITQINSMNDYLAKSHDDFYSGGHPFDEVYKSDLEDLDKLQGEFKTVFKKLNNEQ